VREERPVAHPSIAEKTVYPVEEPGEPLGIEMRGHVAHGETVPKCVVCLPFGRPPPICAEDAEISPVDEADDQAANGKQHLSESTQRRSASEPRQ
jgi:hypothetical protein